MMKRGLVSILMLYSFNSYAIDKINQFSLGLDLSQFSYYLDTKTKLNAAICAQYKPVHFLGLNVSCYINNVCHERKFGNPQLYDFSARGMCFKAGFDGSLPMSRNKRLRTFIGLQLGVISFRESGRFVLKNTYWGPHQYIFSTPLRTYQVAEFNAGYQYSNYNWTFRLQYYCFLGKADKKVSYHDEVVEGYKSPFVPGYGYNRRGINFIVMYRLN